MDNQWLIALYVFFIFYFFSLYAFYMVLLVLSIVGQSRNLYQVNYSDRELMAKSELSIPVSIIVPAYNEQAGIINCVYSALNLRYPEYEVIVVNDGSIDKTLPELIDEFSFEPEDIFYRRQIETELVLGVYRSAKNPNLLLVDKENGGKADAINAGVNLSRYRYVCTIDADTILAPEALLRISRNVNLDPGEVVGAGGQIRVGNGLEVEKGEIKGSHLPSKLIERLQLIEYLHALLGNRIGWNEIGAIHVIPGAMGMWRRDFLIDVGGMSRTPTCEDLDITFKAHDVKRSGKPRYRVLFVPDTMAWTEAPTTWKQLYHQRTRWQRLINEVVWTYKHMLFNPRYGTVGLVGMPYLLVYEVLGPFIEIAAYTVLIITVLAGLLDWQLFLLIFIISLAVPTLISITAILSEQWSYRTYRPGELIKLLLLPLFGNLFYRQFLSFVRIVAFFQFLFGSKQWKRVERKGFEPGREPG